MTDHCGEGRIMTTSDCISKTWIVRIDLGEHAGRTRAVARLTQGPTGALGTGLARMNPRDRDVPRIGDGLAAARALSGLAAQLAVLADLEQATGDARHADLNWKD